MSFFIRFVFIPFFFILVKKEDNLLDDDALLLFIFAIFFFIFFVFFFFVICYQKQRIRDTCKFKVFVCAFLNSILIPLFFWMVVGSFKKQTKKQFQKIALGTKNDSCLS